MNRQILIVDDEEDVRAIAQLGLEMGAGWRVIAASSGEEALSLAAEHQPDAILLDMMMPNLDGRATLHRLKQNPSTQPIPVILMTAKVQSADREAFSNLDVVAVVPKPFRPLQLAGQISEALGW